MFNVDWTPEETEALERLRQNDYHSVQDLHQRSLDMGLMCIVAKREYASDDHKPVTDNWCRSIGAKYNGLKGAGPSDSGYWREWIIDFPGTGYCLVLCVSKDESGTSCDLMYMESVEVPMGTCMTRGEVRLLCRALSANNKRRKKLRNMEARMNNPDIDTGTFHS